jgi:hypothetical protein
MADARHDHSAVRLPSGTVLVAGGVTTNLALKSAETFDSTGKWKATSDLIDRRLRFPLLTLSDGRALTAGGLGTTGILIQAELYSPTLGKWAGTASLNTGRAGHTLTLLTNGKVLAVGGQAVGVGVLSSAEIYTP